MLIVCQGCHTSSLRRSRLRVADLEQLLLLRYPVRCRHCLQRQYCSIFTALALKHHTHRSHASRA